MVFLSFMALQMFHFQLIQVRKGVSHKVDTSLPGFCLRGTFRLLVRISVKSIRGTVPTFVGIGCSYWVLRSCFRAQIVPKMSGFTTIHVNSLHAKRLINQYSLQFTHSNVVNPLCTFFLIFSWLRVENGL